VAPRRAPALAQRGDDLVEQAGRGPAVAVGDGAHQRALGLQQLRDRLVDRAVGQQVPGGDRVPLADAVAAVLPQGPRVEAYDGSSAGPDDADVVVRLQSPKALSHLLSAPGELGMARAYVSGEMDVDALRNRALAHMPEYWFRRSVSLPRCLCLLNAMILV